jgi:hypothetical protein
LKKRELIEDDPDYKDQGGDDDESMTKMKLEDDKEAR